MEFVSYELSKKLKEKGFPQHITDEAYIVDNYGEDECDIGDRLPISLIPDYMDDIAAPTISQILKWLREEKKIHIGISPQWQYTVYDMRCNPWIGRSDMQNYDDYTKAVIAGIEYVIDNLI